MDDSLTIIHFDSRSLYTELRKIKNYLSDFKKFNVIAVSETWLEGYRLFTTNRDGKLGGGVALYIDTSLRCGIVKSMSKVIENVLECITIEIIVEKKIKYKLIQ